MEQVRALTPMDDPAGKLGFVADTLGALRQEVGNATTVLGFIGTPWTLAAYAIEGKADRWGVLGALGGYLGGGGGDWVASQEGKCRMTLLENCTPMQTICTYPHPNTTPMQYTSTQAPPPNHTPTTQALLAHKINDDA